MQPQIKLICFPFSGGTASIYHNWFKEIDPLIQLCPIELAGRNKRFNEPLKTNLNDAIADLIPRVEPLIVPPYAFFGHSLGCLLIYELAQELNKKGYPAPLHIFMSGGLPPHFRTKQTSYHLLPDAPFLGELSRLGGITHTFLENKELQEIFIPIIRADYQMYETYTPMQPKFIFPSNLTALAGDKDEIVNSTAAYNWSHYTHGTFTLKSFEGDHFFVQKYSSQISQLISETLMGKPCITR